MKKVIILCLLIPLLAGCSGNTQPNVQTLQSSESDVVAAVQQLWNAMIQADENLLKSITAEELVYGHSGGKVQNKSEFIAEVMSKDPLVYVSITPLEQKIQMAGNAAIVRHIFTAETINTAGEPGSLRVGNTLVWLLQDGKWKLLARQAYKL